MRNNINIFLGTEVEGIQQLEILWKKENRCWMLQEKEN